MFQPYTSAFALGTSQLVAYPGDRAIIDFADFDALTARFGRSYPLIFKISNNYVCVYPEDGVPSGVLAVPNKLMEELEIGSDVDFLVYLAYPHTVQRIIEWGLACPNHPERET
ncbi:hypothetical protein DU504_11825 [Haloplanus salinus]|uniref:Uncharacterized protein n=1 Tax=Haloplanus salinus TaxID=1126245 RepID=A0A368NEQ1_9EURY|nr:DUF5802 family protein [Haloplanus salinus]RCU47921.1 hypothetical protein DU504_11825 [Haloplanus salinus]